METFKAPIIQIYPLEAIISEKFEAIVKLYELNSRLKDFYDIYFLSKEKNFEISKLNQNLINTFNNRSTPISDRNKIFDQKFKTSADMDKKWKVFLKRNKLKVNYDFPKLIEHLEKFINYPFEKSSDYIWNSGLQKWEFIEQ